MTDDRDDKPDNVVPLPGGRTVRPDLQRAVREVMDRRTRELDQESDRIRNIAANYERHGASRDEALLLALISELAEMRSKLIDAERRLQALERLHEAP